MAVFKVVFVEGRFGPEAGRTCNFEVGMFVKARVEVGLVLGWEVPWFEVCATIEESAAGGRCDGRAESRRILRQDEMKSEDEEGENVHCCRCLV